MDKETERYTGIFVILGMLFVTCLVVSNLIAGKVWSLTDTITVPSSVVLFPVAYILSDIFTEVYGFKRARLVIWGGFLCNFFAVIFYVITVDLPHPSYWLNQDAFAVVLGMTPRVLVASLTGYLVGGFSNSIVISRLKVVMEGRHLWIRAILSTVIGEALDSILFVTIAFIGTIPLRQINSMIVFQYLFKLIFELVFMPVTCYLIGKVKEKEGMDIYDRDKDYRLF
jgi:uncharacterized integral membrane protein (TIGR00697 family)